MADILLLQTDRQLAGKTAEFFSRAGHRARHFSDPQQAVTAIDKSRPDLIIVDLFLAPRSSIEFLFELRSYPDWENIPVIVTGGLPLGEIKNYRASFGELGVSIYIQKNPSSMEELKAAAENILHPAAA
jgi:DNA-binding response OmpR family regulator